MISALPNLGAIFFCLFLSSLVQVASGAAVPRCRHPARLPVADGLHRSRRANDDGIVRTDDGSCATSDNYQCEMCCNGICCENVEEKRYPTFPAGTQMWIPVSFVVIRNCQEGGLCSVPRVTEAEAQRQVGTLNKCFASAKFLFFLQNITHYDDPWLAEQCITDPCYDSPLCNYNTALLPKVVGDWTSEHGVTVVLCDLPYLGEAQWPWVAPEKDASGHYVQVSFKGFATRGAGTYYGIGHTMVHELGHYFGLLHIFEIQGLCDVEGDYVRDTPSCSIPADPDEPCDFERNSCDEGKENDLSDMHNNFMNYASDQCMSFFTTGQVARMQQAVAKYRPLLRGNFLVNGSCTLPDDGVVVAVRDCVCSNDSFTVDEFCGRGNALISEVSSVSAAAAISVNVFAGFSCLIGLFLSL